ncbi:MAG: pyridoxamine 5'-phosphate oxidase family protein, partial [Acidimicrobiales bacterium]
MRQPTASRPHMPGYGILPFDEGTGLLPWTWAAERLEHSHDYWLATCCSDGRPHVMPVWAVWRDGLLWSSSALSSRKARNLAKDGRCTITTDDPLEPVVVEGHAEIERDSGAIRAFLEAMNLKYGTSYEPNFLDPEVNATFRIAPEVVFGLSEDDFTGSPTRWSFDGP